jgi:molybdopterin synthase catalytic subunit
MVSIIHRTGRMDNRDHILYTAVQSKDYGATGAVAACDMTVTMWMQFSTCIKWRSDCI